MAYQTLYRKYRPKSFELVFGQDTIVKTFKNVIKNDKLSHAYLFTGPRGTGKTSCAKLFAKAINCSNNNDGDACNCCEQCKSFNENSNPDIIEIDAASNNGVDEIREIKNKVSLVPSISNYKVYIIDEVHMLSIGAFNALLKTLEEPPSYVIFILATTEPQKLPTTVISRCQRFDFKSISHNKMKECLLNIIGKEKINIEDDALDEIINNSRGGLRDAIGMLDQAFAFSDQRITIDDISELSGSISNKELYELIEDIFNKNYKNIFNKSEKFSNSGKDFSLITEKIINFIRKGIIYKKINDVNLISEEEKVIFDDLSNNKLYMIVDILSDMLSRIQKSYHKKITFEVKMMQLLDRLENNVSNNIDILKEKEILNKECKEANDNVSRETLKEKDNVPRETLVQKEEKVNATYNSEELEMLQKLKDVRINNILKESTKKEILFITELWDNIKNFLLDSKFKISAGILVNSKPVAASPKGIIITLPLESSVNRIEKKYDDSKDLIKQVCGNNYKIVYITDEYWKKIRPQYALKVKNNELELINEEYFLSRINNIQVSESVSDFNDLIEMEEK